jgi:transcriptional regulator with XRE-family HTH domain
MFFLDKINELREFFNLINSELEKILSLSNGYISNIEKSETDNPGKLLIALSTKGISIDWFLTGNGEIALLNKGRKYRNISKYR